MAKETTYAGMMGDWQRLRGLVQANQAELPQLELLVARLAEILARALEVTQRQGAMRAAKQEASKEMRQLTSEGNRLATVIRKALQQHYGISEEKLAEFGLQPFRGRKSKKEEPEGSEAPPPALP
jgi:hypothetical protein